MNCVSVCVAADEYGLAWCCGVQTEWQATDWSDSHRSSVDCNSNSEEVWSGGEVCGVLRYVEVVILVADSLCSRFSCLPSAALFYLFILFEFVFPSSMLVSWAC